jgi:long-chain acyl-CoA synthetase
VRALDPTYVFFIPRDLRSLYRQHLHENRDGVFIGPSVWTMAIGGATIMPDLLQILHTQGIHPNEYFSSAETGLVSCTPRNQWRKTFAGKIVTEVTARIDDEGELEVKSPWVFDGYDDGQESLNRDAFTEDGFCRTGSFAEIMDGYLRVVGRRLDV